MCRLTETDFRFDVTLSRWQRDVISRNKVLPPGNEHEASAGVYAVCSSDRQFLIFSTFVLVWFQSKPSNALESGRCYEFLMRLA